MPMNNNVVPTGVEIHLSFDIQDDMEIQRFRTVSRQLGYKAIVADATNGTDTVTQCMSGYTFTATSPDGLYSMVESIRDNYAAHGFVSIREKIELQPWEHGMHRGFSEAAAPTLYWEQHVKVAVSPNLCYVDIEWDIESLGGLISKSRFGKNPDPSKSWEMVTLRANDINDLRRSLIQLAGILHNGGLECVGDQRERVVYDTFTEYDLSWINLRNQQFVATSH